MSEEFSNYYLPKARKAHECTRCGGHIKPGDVYHKWTGRENGEWFHTKWCGFCRPQCPTTRALVEFVWYTPKQWWWRVRDQREHVDQSPLYMAGYKLPPLEAHEQERVQYMAHKTADGWGPWQLEEEDTEADAEAAAIVRRERIFEAIDLERLRQNDKWGGPDHDLGHLPRDWTTLLHRHAARAELRASVDRGGPDVDGYAEGLLAVASLAVAALEEGLDALDSLAVNPDYPVDCAGCGETVEIGDSQGWGPSGEIYCKPCIMGGAIDKPQEPRPYKCDYCSLLLTRAEVIKCAGRYFCDSCATTFNHH